MTASDMHENVFAETGDGKLRFVGDFEALYRDERDPWEQSAETGQMARYYDFSRSRLLETLRPHTPGDVLEVGCGHGHLSAFLQRRLAASVTGMDISANAIDVARLKYPGHRFIVGDIIAPAFETFATRPFDMVIWGQCLWYLLHEIDRAITNTLRCVAPGGIFVVSQAFLRDQRYGTEIANGFEGTLELLMDGYCDALRLIEARYDDGDRFIHRDGLLIFRVL